MFLCGRGGDTTVNVPAVWQEQCERGILLTTGLQGDYDTLYNNVDVFAHSSHMAKSAGLSTVINVERTRSYALAGSWNPRTTADTAQDRIDNAMLEVM